MKGFKSKDVPAPEPFDMAPEQYEEWNELFQVKLISQDSKWSEVLVWMEKHVKGQNTILHPEIVTEILGGMRIKGKALKEAKSALYIALLTNTKGNTKH